MQYDPNVIMEFAVKLYAKANSIIAKYTIIGIVIGLFINTIISKIITTNGSIIIVPIITGAFGYYIGVEKAFWYKLQAQIALCQVQIEKNTSGYRNSNTKDDYESQHTQPIENNQMLAIGQEFRHKNIQHVEIKRILTCSKCNKVYEKGFDGQYCEACGGELYLVDQFL